MTDIIPTPPVPSAAEGLPDHVLRSIALSRKRYQKNCTIYADTIVVPLADALTQAQQERTDLLSANERMTAQLAQVQGERDEAKELADVTGRVLDKRIAQLAAQATVIAAALAWRKERPAPPFGKAADLVRAVDAYTTTLSPAPAPQEEDTP